MPFLDLHPEELVFEGVRLHAAYMQRVSVGNPHDAPVTVEIKCSAAARYQVSPAGPITIPSRGEATLTVRLKVDAFPNRRRGVSGQRDSFHLKGAFFGQKFFSTFYLDGGGGGGGGGAALASRSKDQSRGLVVPQGDTADSNEKKDSTTATTAAAKTTATTTTTTAAANTNTDNNTRAHPRRQRGNAPGASRRAKPPPAQKKSSRSLSPVRSPRHPGRRGGRLGDRGKSVRLILPYQKWVQGSIAQVMAALLQRRSLYGIPIDSLKDMFAQVDQDGSGQLSHGEFHRAMQRLDMGLSVDQVERILQVMDTNNDGEVDWNEFCTAIEYLDNSDGDSGVPATFLATRLEAAQKDAQRLMHHATAAATSSSAASAASAPSSAAEYDAPGKEHPADNLDATLALERSMEEERSQRVLSILEAKDTEIATLKESLDMVLDTPATTTVLVPPEGESNPGGGGGGGGRKRVQVDVRALLDNMVRLKHENARLASQCKEFEARMFAAEVAVAPQGRLEERVREAENEQERLEVELRAARRVPAELRARAEAAEAQSEGMRELLQQRANRPDARRVEDAMLSKIDDLTKNCAEERQTSEGLRMDIASLRKEARGLRAESSNASEALHASEALVRHLRARHAELEALQSTAQETAIESETRLASAMEQLSTLKGLGLGGLGAGEEVLEAAFVQRAALETARSEANALRAKLRMAESELEEMRRRRDIEIRMRQRARPPAGDGRGRVLDPALNGLDDSKRIFGTEFEPAAPMSSLARESTLASVRELELVIEEQALSIVSLRQALVRAGMKHRNKLRSVEEDIMSRNERVAMLQAALRNRSLDGTSRIKSLETQVSSLRTHSALHEKAAKAMGEAASLRKSGEHLLRENEALRKDARVARGMAQNSKLELDALHKVVADLQMGQVVMEGIEGKEKKSDGNIGVVGMTAERLATLLSAQHGKNTSIIEDLRLRTSELSRMVRRLGGDPGDEEYAIETEGGTRMQGPELSPRRYARARSTFRKSSSNNINNGTGDDSMVEASAAQARSGFSPDGVPLPSARAPQFKHGLSRVALPFDSETKGGDMDLGSLHCRQLEARLESSELECQDLYRQVHALRSEVIDSKESHAEELLSCNAMNAKHLQACNARVASYASENQLLRANINTAECRLRDTSKRLQAVMQRERKAQRGRVDQPGADAVGDDVARNVTGGNTGLRVWPGARLGFCGRGCACRPA
jgi:hypothetical protein